MFISSYNRLACQFLEGFDFHTAPSVCIIVGAPGLGKTTLLKYVYSKAQKQVEHPLFVDAQKYSNKFAYAASHRELSAFRKYYRSANLLVVDNLNRFQGKQKTIEELFHTLETIWTHGGKAVLAYEGKEFSLDFLGSRLASRLQSGFIIRLQRPTPDELKAFAEYYLASINQLNLLDKAELSGAVSIQDIVWAADSLCQVTAKEIIEPLDERASRLKNDFQLVLAVVSDHFGVDPKEVKGNSKKAEHVRARYLHYLILHDRLGYTYLEICRLVKKNVRDLECRCIKLKEGNKAIFETLCQKLYN